jgi:hypothetical protein
MRNVITDPKTTWQVLAITLLGLGLCMGIMVIPSTWAGEFGDVPERSCAGKICSKTARAALKGCRHEARQELWITKGGCANLVDESARLNCIERARADFGEHFALCRDQYDARLEACDEIGEAAYDPVLDPDQFVDFAAVITGASFTPNPYFSLIPGTRWTYKVIDAGGNQLEHIQVDVLAETREIMGISCIVVHDLVWEGDDANGRVLIEDTKDWYAQDLVGNVWYMGEIAKNYEDGELVDVAGSWKAGRDLAQPGIMMLADLPEGRWYRQEFLLGEAEDMAEVVGILDELIVSGKTYHNVLQTRDFTPVQPDVLEYKYYAPGVGMVLEENPVDGERVELVRLKTP